MQWTISASICLNFESAKDKNTDVVDDSVVNPDNVLFT